MERRGWGQLCSGRPKGGPCGQAEGAWAGMGGLGVSGLEGLSAPFLLSPSTWDPLPISQGSASSEQPFCHL